MQFARPANDISLGGWNGPAWSKINEIVPDDDGSYTEKIGSGTLEIGLSGVNDPGIRTDHIIQLRVKQQTGAGAKEKLLCELYDGSTKITEILSTLTRAAYITVEHAIPEAEANLIADYNLILKFTPTQGSSEVMRITWAEVKVPDVVVEEHSGSGSISGNGSLIGTIKKGGKGSALKSAGGTLLAIGLAGMLGIASIVEGGSQIAVGKKDVSASAFISASAVPAGIGTKQALGDSAITGGGSVSASGEANKAEEYSGIAAITGRGALVGLGTKSAEGIGAISGAGTITAGEEVPIPVATGTQVSREERGLLLISNPGVITFIGEKKPVLISKK